MVVKEGFKPIRFSVQVDSIPFFNAPVKFLCNPGQAPHNHRRSQMRGPTWPRLHAEQMSLLHAKHSTVLSGSGLWLSVYVKLHVTGNSLKAEPCGSHLKIISLLIISQVELFSCKGRNTSETVKVQNIPWATGGLNIWRTFCVQDNLDWRSEQWNFKGNMNFAYKVGAYETLSHISF